MGLAIMAYLHKTKYSFLNVVWHKVTGDKGMVFGIKLRENNNPLYMVIFEDGRNEAECFEVELQDEPVNKSAAL